MNAPGRIVALTGTPGAGKTTLAAAWAATRPRAMVIPVDEIRDFWVRTGHATSFEWTDETVRQFALAEASACDVARRYALGGFDVLIDHCRNLNRWDQMVADHLVGLTVIKVCLIPQESVALNRNHLRTNKTFPTHQLDDIIKGMAEPLRADGRAGWVFLDNSHQTVEETLAELDDAVFPSQVQ